MAQVDCFLKIAGLDGESVDAKHQGEIEVESFSWGETAAPGTGSSSGPAANKTQAQDFQFVKKSDKSSPLLMLGCATGQQYKHAILSVRKAGGSQHEYLKVTLDGVVISSYQVAADAQSNASPMDQVSLHFARLEMSYKEQKADGSLGVEVRVKYDFVANRKL